MTTTRSKRNCSGWRAEFHRTVTANPFIPVDPSLRQAAFLANATTLELGYGGAAGGGKSVALLAASLQYAETPGYHALLLRRTFAELSLPEGLIPLSHQWLSQTRARWNEQQHRWTFPSGASLTFGYCESDRDIYRYQGPAFAFLGWDELTQFNEQPYLYLFSRLRKRTSLPIPLRVRSSFNPGGIGHEWVRQRFLVEQAHDRRFIPARLEDNPYLDRDAYEVSLARLDPVTRAQLRDGDWDVRPEGNLFKREWFIGKTVDRPGDIARRVRFWDLAATEVSASNPDPDYTAGVLIGADTGGGFCIEDVKEFRASPAGVEANVRDVAQADGRDVEIFIEQEPGASGKSLIDHYARHVLPGYTVRGVRATGDKITRAKPFSAACQNGFVRLIRAGWNGLLLNRLVGFGLPGVHDDVTDAAAGAHRALTGGFENMDGADWHNIMSYPEGGQRSARETLLERLRQRESA